RPRCAPRAIFVIQTPVAHRVDRVIRLVLRSGETAVLAENHRAVAIGALRMQVAELVYPGERDVLVRIVEHRATLVILQVNNLLFEIQGTPAEHPGAIAEEAVNRASVDDRLMLGNLFG